MKGVKLLTLENLTANLRTKLTALLNTQPFQFLPFWVEVMTSKLDSVRSILDAKELGFDNFCSGSGQTPLKQE